MAERFRKKPVEVEAMQYDGWNMTEIAGFVGTSVSFTRKPEHPLFIDTSEGRMEASVGDWIICGIKGEFYPCKPDIFEATYERVPMRQITTTPPRSGGGA